jgi:HEAT repeat protein
MAALLDDDKLREKARVALVELNTPEARAALRERLKKDDADFQCALLDGLGQLKDTDSLNVIEPLTKSDNTKVRIAAMRALSWTGNPSYLTTAKEIVRRADKATHSDAMDAMLRLTIAIAEKSNRQICN